MPVARNTTARRSRQPVRRRRGRSTVRLDSRVGERHGRWEGALRFVFGVAVIAGFFSLVWRSGHSVQNGADVENGIETRHPAPIVIDAGHGGADGGTVGNGFIEKNLTLQIAERIRHRLLEEGFPVILTRDRDVTLPLRDRAALANRLGARLFVSIHCNAGGSGAEGIETFFSSPKAMEATRPVLHRHGVQPGDLFDDERPMLLADTVQKALCETTGARDRGTKNRPELAVTRFAEAPAILVECGFLSDAGEAARLASEEYQARLVDGLVRGIRTFLDHCEVNPSFGIVHQRGTPSPLTTPGVAEVAEN